MNRPGLRVPRSQGEAVRRALQGSGLLDLTWEILREDDHLVLPLVEGRPPPRDLGERVEREFLPVGRRGPSDYRELVVVPAELRPQLPRSFDVVGDIVLVRIPDELALWKEAVGSALLEFVPGARLVGADRGVRGPERRRDVERIAGGGEWRTRHRENGIEFDVDVREAYFSPRLAREHERVAEEVRRGDRVYDLCCGVGPFALSIARDGRAEEVTAVDANPAAIALLRSTLQRHSFSTRVNPVEARIEEFLPRAAPVGRTILNLPHEGIKYLPSVARVVARGGRLYYYEVTPRAEVDGRKEAIMAALGIPGSWRLAEHHVVHPYSPMADLRAFVLERGEE